MPSRSRDYHRSRSRADNVIDALESGRLRDAVKELNPSRSSNDSRHHQRQHHNTRAYDYYDEGPPRRGRYDDYYLPDNDGYYYDSRRRHRSAHSDRHHDDRRGRSSHKRSSSSHDSGLDLKQVAGAAVTAGVIEAWRSRHNADRAMRVATAAIGAAATDSALGGHRDGKDKRHVIESALAGLVENRVINGPRH